MNPPVHYSERDELEQHLGINLRDYSPEAPHHLWLGIEARLPKRQKRRPILWWLSGLSMVAMLTGANYRYGGYESREEIALASIQDKSDFGEQPTALAKPMVETVVPDWTTDRTTIVSNQVIPVGRTTLYTAVLLPISPKTTEKKIPPKVLNTGGGYIQKKQETTALNLPISHFAGSLLENTGLLFLKIHPKTAVLSLKNDIPALPSFQPVIVHKQHSRWQIAVLAGPVWLWQSASFTPPHHMPTMAFPENNDGPATGWQTGLSANFALKARWHIGLGLLRRSTVQVSSHQANLRLMDGVCLNPYDLGPKEYEFQYALQSSTVPTQVTVRIAQVDSTNNMPTDEPFTLDMRTTRRHTDWVLPLTLKHHFGRGRGQGFVQGGLALHISGRTAMRVEHFTEQCIDLCFASDLLPTLLVEEHEKASLAWVLGGGFDYRLTRHMGLSVAPSIFSQKGQTGLALTTGLTFHF